MSLRSTLRLLALTAAGVALVPAALVGCTTSSETGDGDGGAAPKADTTSSGTDNAGGSDGTGGTDGTGGSGDPPDACPAEGEFRACELEGDAAGQPSGGQRCTMAEDGSLGWNECDVPESAASTPLVLAFEGERVEFAASDRGFPLSTSVSVVTDWPTSATPWLALDRNGNGRIDDGSELFGSATPLARGGEAKNGFEALAELDANGDGEVDARDPGFASLVLWKDRDGDRVSSAAELETLASAGVTTLAVRYAVDKRCDERGNCERERAAFSFTTRGAPTKSGALVDVHLRHR